MKCPEYPEHALIVSRAVADSIVREPILRAFFSGVVSIGSISGEMLRGWTDLSPERRLRLSFDDITHEHHASYGFDPCTEDHIKRLVEFEKRCSKGRLLIHCAQGVSRSSAVAYILLALRLNHPNEALKLLLSEVREAEALAFRDPKEGILPNRRVVWLADDYLGLSGALYQPLITHLGHLYTSTYTHWRA